MTVVTNNVIRSVLKNTCYEGYVVSTPAMRVVVTVNPKGVSDHVQRHSVYIELSKKVGKLKTVYIIKPFEIEKRTHLYPGGSIATAEPVVGDNTLEMLQEMIRTVKLEVAFIENKRIKRKGE